MKTTYKVEWTVRRASMDLEEHYIRSGAVSGMTQKAAAELYKQLVFSFGGIVEHLPRADRSTPRVSWRHADHLFEVEMRKEAW